MDDAAIGVLSAGPHDPPRPTSLMAGTFAIPSVIFRPIVGSLIDGWQHRLLLRSGALAIATLPLLLVLLPPRSGTQAVA